MNDQANIKTLRKIIREAVRYRYQQSLNKSLTEEKQLRQIIRHLITEVDADANPAPYESTALNALADAFNQILPVLETGLRKLKRPEERQSYRAHILQKFKSIFDTFEGLDAGENTKVGEGPVNEQEDDSAVSIKIDDEARVMPSDGKEDDRFKEEEPNLDPDEKDLQDLVIGTEDPTGARRAFNTINNSNIEKLLADTRKLLVRPEDRQEFKEYALYNVDLWLLSYEKDIADENGEAPAFDKVIMPKPEGAEVAAKAKQFVDSDSEEVPQAEDEIEQEETIDLPSIAEFE